MSISQQVFRIGLCSVSALALLIAIAAPTAVMAASGGQAITNNAPTKGGAGGVDGTEALATGQSGANSGQNNVGGGGGAVNLSTGNGAAGGGQRLNGSLGPGPAGGTGAAGSTAPGSVVNGAVGGGNGGDGTPALPATYGSTGGGGGGVGIATHGDLTVTGAGSVIGGSGGLGISGSGGGGGGVGIFSSASVSVGAGNSVTGGAGGRATGSGGGGGGAAAIVLTNGGTINNSGVLQGGAGGSVLAQITNAAGGSGGEGILLTNGGRITNSAGASITGGGAGVNGTRLGNFGIAASVGGAGIKGANISIVNAGTIAGGAAANAITFTSGTNSLELWSTSVITGKVAAGGSNDTLAFGGSGNGTFNAGVIGAGAQYEGFERFEKTGASTWLLTGTPLGATPWTLSGGILSLAADGSLGSALAPLTFNGGTLHTSASFSSTRAVSLTTAGSTVDTAAATNLQLTGVLSGAGGLAKTGDGILELSGQNSFSGQTVVSAGTLALTGTGSIAASARVVADAIFDISGATTAVTVQRLAGSGEVALGAQTLTLANANDVFSGQFTGGGGLALIAGQQMLTGSSAAFTGTTSVRGGVLSVNGILGGTMDVYRGRLQGTGTVGATTNHAGGTVAPGNSIGVLTVAGDYTSNGGRLEIESVLGGDGSPADLLLITGNSLLGLAPTLVSVINVGGMGTATTNGIKIVDVQGARSDANAFVLNGPAIGGAYRYDLAQNDLATGSDGDWYLRNSGEWAPTVPTLENYPVALLGMIDLPTLRQRGGEGAANERGIVTRIEGSAGHYQAASSTSGASYDSSMFLAQIGMVGRLLDTADGSLTAGLTAQYSRHYASVFSAYGNGSNSTEDFGLGASLTWRGAEGTYFDLQGQVMRFSTDLNAAGYSLVQDNGGAGFAASIEAGHAFSLDGAWALTPQAQLSYASVGFDKFTDRFGSEVSLNKGASLKGRIGLSLDYQTEWQDADGRTASSTLYGTTNLTYEFLDGANVAVSGTDLKFAGQKFGAELGLGGTLDWAGGAHALHGELLGSTSFQGSYAIKGTVGFASRF